MKERTRKLRELNTKVKKIADKSNSDPAYKQAQTECGGYETCVKERTRKLREQNAKADAKKADTKKTGGQKAV